MKYIFRWYWFVWLILLSMWWGISRIGLVNIMIFVWIWIVRWDITSAYALLKNKLISLRSAVPLAPELLMTVHRYVFPFLCALVIRHWFWLFVHGASSLFSFLFFLTILLGVLMLVLPLLKQEWLYVAKQKISPSGIAFIVGCLVVWFVVYKWSTRYSWFMYIYIGLVVWYIMYLFCSFVLWISFKDSLRHISTSLFWLFFLLLSIATWFAQIPNRLDDRTIVKKEFVERQVIPGLQEEVFEDQIEQEVSPDASLLDWVLDDADDSITDRFLDAVGDQQWVDDNPEWLTEMELIRARLLKD